MPMKDSKLLGLTGDQIHTLIHGGTLKATGQTWKGSLLGEMMRATYGSPTWFKTTVNYSFERGVGESRK